MSTPPQSQHWVDKLAAGIWQWQAKTNQAKLHVDDMKTPSGRVHTGALRGVLLHDLVAKTLEEARGSQQTPIHNTYVIDDMDPMDGLPSYLDAEVYTQHMGKPLYKIPAPSLEACGIDLSRATPEELADFKTAQNFAEIYAFDFMHAFRKLGCSQELVWSHQLYESGQMDETIRLALDNVDKFRKIYKEVADYDLPPNWFPFQVTCPECGKVGTTLVTGWDGAEVTFECQPNKVEWAIGCGHTGKISPFGGNGKLLWKVDWPAHWRVLGVNIEGAGKDHTSAGSSRDMANAICQQVFNITVPFDIPYEWILIRGTKMSSSKGVGTSAREFTELLPPEIGRFLFVNKHYNQVIDFDPRGEAIPDLFDEYDQAARIFWKKETGDQRLGRAFELSQIGIPPAAHFLPRFRDIATWMQYPELDLIEKVAGIKGDLLTETELEILKSRVKYAKRWIEIYAPKNYQFTPTQDIPKEAITLSPEQLDVLGEIIKLTQSAKWSNPQDLQQAIFDLAKQGIGPKLAFQAIYLAFLGKTHGPRAAWLLLSIPDTILNSRVDQIKSQIKVTDQTENKFPDMDDDDLFEIDPQLAKAYPSLTIGIAIIEGVDVQMVNQELEKEKESYLNNLVGLTAAEINHLPEIASYRKLYQETNVNWNKRKSSPAALLIRAGQGKGMAQVNSCVDGYNLAVIKNRVSAGAFNLDQIKLPTMIKAADGGETIEVIGEDEPIVINQGEVCYFDQIGPYNLDLNFRDAIRTAVDSDTKNLLINVEGVYDITRQQVEKTLQEVLDNITKYCGGKIKTAGIYQANRKS